MASVNLDSTSICRVCMGKSSNSVSLFGMNNSKDLITKIMACATVQINADDDLPSQICEPCCDKLETAFTFKTVCETSDYKLRQLLLQNVAVDEKKELIKLEADISPFITLEDIKVEFTLDDNQDGGQQGFGSEDEYLIHHVTKNKSAKTHKKKDSKHTKKIKVKKEKSVRKKKILKYDGEDLDDCETKLKRTKKTPKSGDTFPCTYCKKPCLSASMLVIHTRVHTGERPFLCSHCNKAFSSKGSLQCHERIHTGERPYVCKECGRSFSHRSHLVTHERIHSGARPYKCKLCSKAYAQVGPYNDHVRTHTGERPFICNFCGKTFGRRNNWINHAAIHTGEKKYKCDVCDKAFIRDTNLKVHQRTHTGEKPYECEFCKKRFAQLDHLNNHRNRHINVRPFKCHICEKTFPSRSNLARHKVVHSKTREPSQESQCEVCQKWVVNMKSHLRTHQENRQKTSLCKYCGRNFFWSQGLMRHIKRAHPGLPYREKRIEDVSHMLEVAASKAERQEESNED